MKKIEKQLIKSAKRLPSIQKEIVFLNKKNNFNKAFYRVVIAVLSLMICLGITLSIKFDLIENAGEIIKSVTKSESTTKSEPTTKPESTTKSESDVVSESTASVLTNKTITIPINVNFEGDTSQTKNVETDTYEVIEGDTVILDVRVNVTTNADIGNIMSTINFDSTKLSFVSCSNNTYRQESGGKILVQFFGTKSQERGTTFKIVFKAVSSGPINVKSEISCSIIVVPDLNDLIKESDEKHRKDMEEYNKIHGIYGSIDDVVGNYDSGYGNGNSDKIVVFP